MSLQKCKKYSSAEIRNYKNQKNPNNKAYWESRREMKDYLSHKAEQDNRSRQLNPNNDAYWKSRGETVCITRQSSNPPQQRKSRE